METPQRPKAWHWQDEVVTRSPSLYLFYMTYEEILQNVECDHLGVDFRGSITKPGQLY